MGKRLTISDYLFAFLFIFMFFCIIVAFFYGVDVGNKRAAEQYEQLLKAQTVEALPEELSSYHQQHLVSFYYNVYYPFRTFQSSWTNTLTNLGTEPPAEVRKAVKKLSETAKEVYTSIETMTIPATSPLLQEAQTNYLRALRLFQEADARLAESKEQGSSRQMIDALLADPYITDGFRHATSGQDNYYEAIVRWHESVVVELAGIDQLGATQLSLAEWHALPFNVQNSIIARSMADHLLFTNYTPQDMTAALTAMIESGRADSLGVQNVEEAVRLLHDTNAVRSGDYFGYKDLYFQDEIKPQLPFYDEPQ